MQLRALPFWILVAFSSIVLLVSASPNEKTKINKKVKNVNINHDENTKVSMKEKHKYNFQVGQIVVNVPKAKSQTPTHKEFVVHATIRALYAKVKEQIGQSSVESELLGRVLDSLDPTCVATNRIYALLTAPDFKDIKLDPLPYTLNQAEPIKLDPNGSIQDQLDRAQDELEKDITIDPAFVQSLANTPNEELSPIQVAMKQAVMCLGDQCPISKRPKESLTSRLDRTGVSKVLGRNPLKGKLGQEEYDSKSPYEEVDEEEDEDEDEEVPPPRPIARNKIPKSFSTETSKAKTMEMKSSSKLIDRQSLLAAMNAKLKPQARG